MKSLKLYLIVAAILLIVYIFAQANRPKAIDWTETLSNKEKTPFGTYIIYNRIKDIFPGVRITPYRQPVYNVLAQDSVKHASYIIICPGIELSKPDYRQLVNYIKSGNDVFIASEYFGKVFGKNLNLDTKTDFTVNSDVIPVKFVNPSLNPKKYYSIDRGAGSMYFNKFDTAQAVVLAQNRNNKANYLKYKLGKGWLYLNANPKFFSNYSLLKPQGAEYAATALSFLKSNKQVIWDEYYTDNNADASSPMRLFLSRPALQWAYYIGIVSLLLFVLFEIKRRQRIIPVIEPLTNTTLEFVNVVGQVYYEKRNNANIAHKKILYLLTDLRDSYQLKTNKLDNEFIDKLSAKLDIESQFSNKVVNYIKYISVQERVSDRELIELNKLTDQLYRQSK